MKRLLASHLSRILSLYAIRNFILNNNDHSNQTHSNQKTMDAHLMQGPMEIQIDRKDDVVILYISGPVNVVHSPRLREAILTKFDGAKGMVVDLADVIYMDSSGLATLVEGIQQAENNRKKFVLSRVYHERVQHLMEITRLTELFEVHETVDEAVQATA